MEAAITAIMALSEVHFYGAGVIYLGPVGNVLRCDRPGSPLVYSKATAPWVAFSDAMFKSGAVQCGDYVLVREHLPDGTTRSFTANVYDSGSFGDHTTLGGLPIVVDGPPWVVSWPMYPGWARVEVFNFSAVARECRKRGICD